MVSNECVEEAFTTINHYSDEEMHREFERFFLGQPALCDFVMELTSESGQIIQGLTLFMSYIVLKATELSVDGNLDVVVPTSVEQAYRESEAWIEKMTQVVETELGSAMASMAPEELEPHLLEYVVSTLNDPLEDGTELTDEQKGEVFLALKTVIASVSRST